MFDHLLKVSLNGTALYSSFGAGERRHYILTSPASTPALTPLFPFAHRLSPASLHTSIAYCRHPNPRPPTYSLTMFVFQGTKERFGDFIALRRSPLSQPPTGSEGNEEGTSGGNCTSHFLLSVNFKLTPYPSTFRGTFFGPSHERWSQHSPHHTPRGVPAP